MKKLLLASLCLLVTAGAAWADWDPIDGHKMHYPQLPNPTGWDVKVTAPKILADDWKCSGTGPVTDIHFWGSWKGDLVGNIQNIHLSIHADDRTGAFSKPGEVLWSREATDWGIRPVDPPSLQGWYDPNTGTYIENDHQHYFQYNIENILNPFMQQLDTIYWLDIQVMATGGEFGWKTSGSPHFEDDAVWGDWDPILGMTAPWAELKDPLTGASLDLAFVITGPVPEPSSLLALGSGIVGLAGFALRRRRV